MMKEQKNQKILLYLSELKGQKKNSNGNENPDKKLEKKKDENQSSLSPEYSCPDNIVVRGTQSNEAPVKFLLKKYPNISEIICIVTNEAKKTAEGAEMSAWDFFKREIKKEASQVRITPIDYDYDQENGIASIEELVGKVLKCFKEDENDEIFLETTGGPRDTMIYLLLISRILSHAKIPVRAAVYSNFNKKKVESLSDTIQLFDLVEGMQELTSFGSVEKIRDYYKHANKKDEKIDNMLKAAKDLTETISLCRTEKLDEKMESFNEALVEAEKSKDVLFGHMLAAFRDKFAREKWNVLSVLNWCIESGMVQQALTIYTERIPAYIFEKKLIEADETVERGKEKEYEDKNVILFLNGFLGIAGQSERKFRKFLKENKNIILDAVEDSKFSTDELSVNSAYRKGVDRILQILRHFYKTNKKKGKDVISDKEIEQFKDQYKEFDNEEFDCLMQRKQQSTPQTREKMYNSICESSNEVMVWLMGRKGKEDTDNAIVTLEYLEELLPDSGFHVHCSCEEIRKVAEEYCYIKYLRNMVNHASADGKVEKKQFLKYLYQREYTDGKKYKNIEDMSLQDIKDFINVAAKRIEDLV